MDKFSIFWNVHLIIVVGWYYKFLSTAIAAFLFTEQRSLLWKLPFFFDQSFLGGKIYDSRCFTTQLKNRIFFKDPLAKDFFITNNIKRHFWKSQTSAELLWFEIAQYPNSWKKSHSNMSRKLSQKRWTLVNRYISYK